jgi:peptidoglycan/xylan/chitin deacetylase (PgdA/CDA1 family)
MKDILFTIDDGPSPDTKRLADFLVARQIPVIMFFIGENMEKYPDEVDHVIQAGITIGNHTYNHPAMSTLSLEENIQQIEKTEGIIEAAYQRNARARAHKLFRFPFLDTGGANRPAIMQYLADEGFEHVQAGFVTHKWFDEYRLEPHIGGSFHCFDWELWLHPETFGIPEMLKELHTPGEGDRGSIFNGDSGEIVIIHDAGWKTKKDERHYEIVVEELDKAKIRYLEPAF